MNKLRIRRLGVLSIAKIYAVMMLVMSLLISIPYGLFIMFFGVAMIGTGEKGRICGGRRQYRFRLADNDRLADLLWDNGFCMELYPPLFIIYSPGWTPGNR